MFSANEILSSQLNLPGQPDLPEFKTVWTYTYDSDGYPLTAVEKDGTGEQLSAMSFTYK